MSKQKLIVISFDALVYEDTQYLKNKPNFAYIMENGAMANRVKSIYPALTYPCHTTMITGCYPDKHGVINNTYDVISKAPPFKFDHENVTCEDLMDVCKKAGLTTASIGWPVSGNHPSVDYLIPECWPIGKATDEEFKELYINLGTKKELFDEVVAPYFDLRLKRGQPETSYFYANICATLIKKYQPDVIAIHPSVIDTFRHKTGVFSPLVTEGLDHCDKILEIIIDATKKAGVFEDTNFVVTADHGQLDVTQAVNLNCIFAENGLIDVDKNENVKSYKAWSFPMGGMSAYIRLSDPSDKQLYNEVYDLLKEKRDEGTWGFSEVFTREECRKMHLDGDFSFVVETDGHTRFENAWTGDACIKVQSGISGQLLGDHGYHPDKGPKPTFIACGPAIKKGAIIENANLVDGAPTYAKILGVNLPNADGRALEELLR